MSRRRIAAGRPAGGAARGGRGRPRAGWRCRRSGRPARCWPRPVRARRSATPPSSRWPAPPAAASPPCSTRCRGGEISTPGVRRPTTGVAHATVWGERRRRPAARLAGGAPPAPARARAGAGRAGPARPARPRQRPAGAPPGGRPAGGAGRRPGLGARPGEVRRRRGARPLPGAAGRARRRAARRPQPGRPARRRGGAGLPGRPARPARPRGAGRRPRCWRCLGRAPVPGVAELRGELAHRVAARRAATDRLTADVRGAAADAGGALPRRSGPPAVREPRRRAGRLGRRAGRRPPACRRSTAAVERSDGARRHRAHRLAAACAGRASCGPTRCARLHLGDERARTSLPPAGPVELAAVATAVRRARDAAGDGLPQAWRDDLRRTVDDAEARLPDRLDRGGRRHGPRARADPALAAGRGRAAVGPGARRPGRRPVAAGAGRPRASSSSTTSCRCRACRASRCRPCCWSPGCWPGSCSRCVARPLVRMRARRRGRAAGRRLRAAVAEVADDEVFGPMAEVGEDAARFCQAVAGHADDGPLQGTAPSSARAGEQGVLFQSRWVSPERGSGSWLRRRSGGVGAAGGQAGPDVLAARALLPAVVGRQLGDQVQPHAAERGVAVDGGDRRAVGRLVAEVEQPAVRDRRPRGRGRRRRRAAARWRPAPRRPAAGRRGRPRSRRRRPTGGRCGRAGR